MNPYDPVRKGPSDTNAPFDRNAIADYIQNKDKGIPLLDAKPNRVSVAQDLYARWLAMLGAGGVPVTTLGMNQQAATQAAPAPGLMPQAARTAVANQPAPSGGMQQAAQNRRRLSALLAAKRR